MKNCTLGKLVDMIDYGITASAADEPVGPKFLRITDIQDGSVNWASVPFCETSPREAMRAALSPGDIVFARTGATTGKSFLIRECPTGAVFASYLIRVRPGKKMHPLYLSHFFQSDDYWSQIAAKANGAAQPGVNASKLSELVVPCPPLQEQERVAGILNKVDELRHFHRKSIETAGELLSCLQHRAFRGEL